MMSNTTTIGHSLETTAANVPNISDELSQDNKRTILVERLQPYTEKFADVSILQAAVSRYLPNPKEITQIPLENLSNAIVAGTIEVSFTPTTRTNFRFDAANDQLISLIFPDRILDNQEDFLWHCYYAGLMLSPRGEI